MPFGPPRRPPPPPPHIPYFLTQNRRPELPPPSSLPQFALRNYPPLLDRPSSRPALLYPNRPPLWTSCPPPPMGFPDMHQPPANWDPFPIPHPQQYYAPQDLTTTSMNPIESTLNQWILTHEPIFRERQQQNLKNKIIIPTFRSKLIRWTNLIEQIKRLRLEGLDIPACLLSELSDLQAHCSNSHVLEQIQLKLRLIRKKRRYRKRAKNRFVLGNDQNAIVLRTSTASVLEMLKPEDTDFHCCPNQSVEPQPISQPLTQDSQSIPTETNKQSNQTHQSVSREFSNNSIAKLRKLITKCKNNDALLTNLAKLREARISQARQRGGLFPEQLDEQFAEQIENLRSMMKEEQSKLEALLSLIQKKMEPDPASTLNNSAQSVCSKHMPDIPTKLKFVLFGDESSHLDVPWRWKRFYHQAQFDFVDFIRIRSSWDSYLVQPGTNDSSQLGQTELSSLPKAWILPPSEPSSEAWKQYLKDDD